MFRNGRAGDSRPAGFALVPLALLALAMAVPAFAEEPAATAPSHVTFGLGAKWKNDDWVGAKDEIVLTLDGDVRPHGWPVSLTAGLSFGYCSRIPDRSKPDIPSYWNGEERSKYSGTYLVDVGVRWIAPARGARLQPFIAGGLGFLGATIQSWDPDFQTSDTERGHVVTPWFEAGFYVPIKDRHVWGVRARYTRGDVTLFRDSYDAGGIEASVFWGWVKR